MDGIKKISFNPVTKLFSKDDVAIQHLFYDDLMSHKKDPEYKSLGLCHTMTGKNYRYLLATKDNYPVGLLAIDLDRKFITQLVINHDYRHQGIATKLLNEADVFYHPDTLTVRDTNTSAQNLYKKLGWKVIGINGKMLEMKKKIN